MGVHFRSRTILVIFSIVVSVLCSINKVSSIPNTNTTSILCNSGVYTKGDPFATSLAYVLSDLEAITPVTKGYNYTNISPFPNSFAYGHATCNSTLPSIDCTTCLGIAIQSMINTCSNRIGARSVLYDCSIRYEQYPFDD
ncbi:hypothetical protein C5167_004752 [Papaver somniferum]|uniref:Gnk2-homologous domain-containing protein n=1 Tax=Papaver somniferum TaxID=3469 RepID=A0A4Y7JCC4_PAPSO|nr:hypothetical protein C5167_004752 [Papaver somniferum]